LGAKEQGVSATSGRWLTVPRTLCFISNGDDVLLMQRAAHRSIFPNRYNGVGGHIERNEEPLSGIKREIREETGLEVRDVRLRAIYHIDAGETMGIILFIFTAISDTRLVVETGDEGILHWVARNRIMDLDLVEDLPQLLPRVFAMGANDPPFFVHISYDENDHIQMSFSE